MIAFLKSIPALLALPVIASAIATYLSLKPIIISLIQNVTTKVIEQPIISGAYGFVNYIIPLQETLVMLAQCLAAIPGAVVAAGVAVGMSWIMKTVSSIT